MWYDWVASGFRQCLCGRSGVRNGGDMLANFCSAGGFLLATCMRCHELKNQRKPSSTKKQLLHHLSACFALGVSLKAHLLNDNPHRLRTSPGWRSDHKTTFISLSPQPTVLFRPRTVPFGTTTSPPGLQQRLLGQPSVGSKLDAQVLSSPGCAELRLAISLPGRGEGERASWVCFGSGGWWSH